MNFIGFLPCVDRSVSLSNPVSQPFVRFREKAKPFSFATEIGYGGARVFNNLPATAEPPYSTSACTCLCSRRMPIHTASAMKGMHTATAMSGDTGQFAAFMPLAT